MIPANGVDLQNEANRLKSNISGIVKTIDKVVADGVKSSNALIGLYYQIKSFDIHVAQMQSSVVTVPDIAPYVERYKGDWTTFQADFTALNSTALPNLLTEIKAIESSILAGTFGASSVSYNDLSPADVTAITPSIQAVKAILS